MSVSEQTLNRYLQDWNLSLLHQVDVDSSCSKVFIVMMADGEKAALKILFGRGIEAEKYGANALRYFDGHGIVKLYRHEERAHLLEYVDGSMLRGLVDRGQDNKATEIICDVVAELHAKKSNAIPEFKHLRDHCADLFTQAAKRPDNIVLHTAAQIGQELLDNQVDARPLHGDVHHENILSSGRGWISIDPNGIIGDPVYEYANTFNNPYGVHEIVGNPARISMVADVIHDRTQYDRNKILKYGAMHIALSASWVFKTGFEKSGVASLRNCEQVLKLVM